MIIEYISTTEKGLETALGNSFKYIYIIETSSNTYTQYHLND